MENKSIIYGVNHDEHYPKKIIEPISLETISGDVIGLEASQKWIDEYDKLEKKYGTSVKNIAKPLGKIVMEKYQYGVKDSDVAKAHSLDFHYFWLVTNSLLKKSGAEVIGLGSDKRSSLLRQLNSPQSTSDEVVFNLLSYNHFERYLIDMIKEKKCNKAVLGSLHAKRIAEPLGFELKILDEESFKRDAPSTVLDALEKLQLIYDSEKYILPDIRD